MKKYVVIALFATGIIFNLEVINASNGKIDFTINKVSDEYKKIPSSELTPPVVEELLKQYPTSKLGAAYRNSKGEFKLIMVLKSGTRRTVYIDSYGNWLDKK